MILNLQKAIDRQYPLRRVETKSGLITYREGGNLNKITVVLLHGIGSASGSWYGQLKRLSTDYRIIAWDAPGYGSSAVLTKQKPEAIDYAEALQGFVDSLNIEIDILVGHSLGALIAGSFAAHFNRSSLGLVLANPASGHSQLPEKKRLENLQTRLNSIAKIGPESYAKERSSALVSKNASEEALDLVRLNMSRLRIDGHAQAAHMLSSGNLFNDARLFSGHVLVLCGSKDTVTPEDGAQRIAAIYPNGRYQSLPDVGHASYIEDPDLFNRAVIGFADELKA